MASWQVSQKIDVEDLKARCDLRKLIPPVLEKARHVNDGEYWSGCCPFHEDRNPSFLVFRDYYRCMAEGCGERGSVIDWFGHLNPNTEWRNLLRLIEREHGSSPVLPARKPVRLDVPKTEPLPEPLPLGDLAEYHHFSDRFNEWLYSVCYELWRLSPEAVAKEGLGFDTRQRALTIPVWGNSYSDLITIRFRNYDNKRMGKYWGLKNRNDVYGYGRQWIKNAKHAVIVMGEMTACFLHHEWGFASFSWTNGCKSFRPYLKPLLSHLEGGVIIPDVGEDDSAAMVAHLLGPNWKVALLEDAGGKRGEDVIDWAKRTGTKEQFCDLIMNRAKGLENGILPYYSSKMNVQWRR